MITRFKSALNEIKAEDALINKTEVYLKDSLAKNQNSKINKFIQWRLLPVKKLAIAACCLVFLLTIGGASGVCGYYQAPVSYLSLDINPSVELGINTFGRVVKAEGYNNDGKKILNGINVKGSDISTAVDTLVKSAINNGYIAKDGSTVISLTSETNDKNTATNLETEAETGAKDALTTGGEKAEVLKDNVALARRDEARKLGVTPGKLNLIQKLQRVDNAATVEQYKDAKVKDIMKAIQNNTDTGAVNNTDTGNVNNNDEGTVESKKQTIDNGNTVNATKSVKNDNVIRNDKGTVEEKKQTIDKRNTVNTKKSVKKDNVDNSNNGHGKGK